MNKFRLSSLIIISSLVISSYAASSNPVMVGAGLKLEKNLGCPLPLLVPIQEKWFLIILV
ncbi:hypothetical protein BH10PSE19_BH10PSE19_19920 [soil metagenome]